MTTVSGIASGLTPPASPANAAFCRTMKIAPASEDVMKGLLISPIPHPLLEVPNTFRARHFENSNERRAIDFRGCRQRFDLELGERWSAAAPRMACGKQSGRDFPENDEVDTDRKWQ